jgi:hypothetical protein
MEQRNNHYGRNQPVLPAETIREEFMFNQNSDLGASLFKTWTDEQRREEIGRLVTGYRNGVPIGILCKMAETIAGSPERAREHLAALMSLEERQAAIEKEPDSMKAAVRPFLL